MQATVLTKPGHSTDNFKFVEDHPQPQLNENQNVRVRVHATAMNPVDYKMANYGFAMDHLTLPGVLGCDAAGEVTEVGAGVADYSVGDRVFAFAPLGVNGGGTFAQEIAIGANFLAKIPDGMSYEEASTFGVGLFTAALGLFGGTGAGHDLPTSAEPLPRRNEFYVVWGGTSSVGAYAVQLANFLGYDVIATSSPTHVEWVKSLGAVHTVNHRDADAVEQIRTLLGDKPLRGAFSAISQQTSNDCLSLLTSEGDAHLSFPAGGPEEQAAAAKPNVKLHNIFLGAAHYNDGPVTKHCFAINRALHPLIVSGAVKPNRPRTLKGLAEIPNALALVRDGKASGFKVVVQVE